MQVFGDYHTHTFSSDGRSTEKQVVETAIERGLFEVAITDHGAGSLLCGLTCKKFEKQASRIEKLKPQPLINILHGVEANIIDESGNIDIADEMIRGCDVLVCGFHRLLRVKIAIKNSAHVFVNGWGSKKSREKRKEINTEAYVNALKKYPIDVLAHVGHRAIVDVKRVCEVAKECGTYVELNAKHLDVIEDCIDDVVASGVKFVISSDAHDKKDVGKLDKVTDFVKKHNIPTYRVCGVLNNYPKFKDKTGWGL